MQYMMSVKVTTRPLARASRVRFPACPDDASYELLVDEAPAQGQPRAVLRVTSLDGETREMVIETETVARA
jgi:hypothetical protein